jgi:hypothetical protein
MLGYINLDTTFLFRDPLDYWKRLQHIMTYLKQSLCFLLNVTLNLTLRKSLGPSALRDVTIVLRLRMEIANAISSLVHVTPQCHGIHDMSRYTRTRRMRCYARHPTRSAPIQQKSMPNLLHGG